MCKVEKFSYIVVLQSRQNYPKRNGFEIEFVMQHYGNSLRINEVNFMLFFLSFNQQKKRGEKTWVILINFRFICEHEFEFRKEFVVQQCFHPLYSILHQPSLLVVLVLFFDDPQWAATSNYQLLSKSTIMIRYWA